MSDSFTETVTTGWFSRIGSSIKGILVGIVLIVIAFPVLFFNEGRAVDTRKDLNQGAKECVIANSESVDAANEGKLVHLSGMATAEGSLADDQFAVKAEALVLKRNVEMYQWKEKTDTKTKKKLGGSEEKTTTYSYEKTWQSGRIDYHCILTARFSNQRYNRTFTMRQCLIDLTCSYCRACKQYCLDTSQYCHTSFHLPDSLSETTQHQASPSRPAHLAPARQCRKARS